MNVVDLVESARPEVDPMPLTERRMIRERLFGVGHADVTRTISARSASGAVVSTAPHGTRAKSADGSSARGSLARVGAGLALVAVLGGIGWAVIARGDDDAESVSTTAAPDTTVAATTTAAPTTLAPIERTGVTVDFPIVLPLDQLTVENVSTDPPPAGSSTVMFRAPDDSVLWMAEVDGDAGSTNGLDVQTVGAIEVGVSSNFSEGNLASYQPQVPCGLALLNDAPGQPLYRPELTALLQSTSIDADATIDMSLPDGWSIIDVGPGVNTFTAEFRVPTSTGEVQVTLLQAPGGSISQLAFGGRQLQPTTFLGSDAFLNVAPLSADITSIFWRDADTVFNVTSSGLDLVGLESFVEGLDPIEIAEWEERFGLETPRAPVLDSECVPQPSLGTTINP